MEAAGRFLETIAIVRAEATDARHKKLWQRKIQNCYRMRMMMMRIAISEYRRSTIETENDKRAKCEYRRSTIETENDKRAKYQVKSQLEMLRLDV